MSEKQKLGQEPAFSSSFNEFDGHDSFNKKKYIRINNAGMSKRFYAACTVIQGFIAMGSINPNGIRNPDYENIVTQSYALADELLKQEDK